MGVEVVELGNLSVCGRKKVSEEISMSPDVASSEKASWILHIHGLAHGGMRGGRTLTDLKKLGIPVVLWVQNDELDYDETAKVSPLYDLFCCYTRITEERHRELGAKYYYLPLAADHTIYKPVDLKKEDRERYGHDLVIIGWKHQRRQRLIEELSKYYNIFCNWDMKMPSVEINKIYNASKIMLSAFQDCDEKGSIFNTVSSIKHDRAWGLPCRTFEVPASRGFQIQESRVHLRDCYDERKGEVALVSAFDGDRRVEKWRRTIDYYLEKAEEREKVAQAGYKRTMREHLYRHRMECIVRELGKKSGTLM